jgi:hypothetical protein
MSFMPYRLTPFAFCLAVLALAPSEANAQSAALPPPPAHLSAHVERTGQYFSAAARLSPGLMSLAMQSYKTHGIAALLNDDPEVRREADRVGALLGAGLWHLSEAVRKDMVLTVERSRPTSPR